MLQQPTVDDFVLATGQLHTVRDFVATAFARVPIDWTKHIRHDANLLSSVEHVAPCGNPAKAERILGWKNTVPFEEMVHRLVDAELTRP